MPYDPDPRKPFVATMTALLMASCASVAPAPGLAVPPAHLLADCGEPTFNVITNRDLAEYTLELRNLLRGCNADKSALRQWAEEVTNGNP